MKRLVVENFSVSGVAFVSKYLREEFPGHSIGEKATVIEIPLGHVKEFKDSLAKQAPAIKVTEWKKPEPEPPEDPKEKAPPEDPEPKKPAPRKRAKRTTTKK